MTCGSCGTVGPAGAAWCPKCYLPYARVGAPQAVPAAFNAFAAPPAYTPPAYVPPSYTPRGYPPMSHPPVFGTPMYGQQPQWPADLGLVVPQPAVEVGDLPRICVVSGLPTDSMVKMSWTWAPLWTYALIVLGILPALVVRYFLGDRVDGYLPIHPAVRRARRLWVAAALLGMIAGLALWVTAVTDNSTIGVGAGLALMASGLVTLIAKGRLVLVKRAAVGFLAIPKARPEFAAAFDAGRPVAQVPYAPAAPAVRTRKVFLVLAAIVAPFMVVVAIYGFYQEHRCQLSSLHPNVAEAQADFTESQSSVAAINAQGGGHGLDSAQATQLIAVHTRLMSELSTVRLNAADQRAVDTYTAVLRQYDAALLASERLQSDAGDQSLREAESLLDSQGAALTTQLQAVPVNCQDN